MPGKNDDIHKILMKAGELEADGKIKNAIKELRKAAKLDVKDGNLYNRLGDLLIKDKNTDDAISAYKKGVEIFRDDTFYRNALALCKKILRYDPGNIEIYSDIAKLLLDLDEKSDALIYYFAYVDKQLAQNNEKEVLVTIDAIKDLGIFDGKVIKKINEAYKTLGRDDLLKDFAKEIMKEDVSDDIILEEITEHEETKPTKSKSEKKVIKPTRKAPASKKEEKQERKIKSDDHDRKMFKENVEALDKAVKNVESAITQLRKAIRLDEVILALEKSLTSFSEEQKKSIALLQKSISHNLDTLEKSVKKMHESSEDNMEQLTPLMAQLSKDLAKLSSNQKTFSQDVNENLSKVGKQFDTTMNNMAKEITKLMTESKDATDTMCDKLKETTECSLSQLDFSKEMKHTVQEMSEVLTKYIIAQEIKEKRQGKFVLAVIVLIAIIIVLLGISIFI